MTGWFSTADFVTRNRDAVDRFTHAIAEATVCANAHEAEMIPLLAPFLKVDPQLVARTMKGSEGIYLDPASIQPMIEVTAKYGIIDHAFTAADIISPAALKRPAHA
jgi:ABC-type nitrate/sulfonate/bicarbonate transport system substrate-binding protein